MNPDRFLHDMIRPGLDELFDLGGPSPNRRVERFMLAIALQESDARHRYQHSPQDVAGPARGWWQFEQAGVLGVLTHRASRVLAEQACRKHWVVHHAHAVHRALEGHDRLACIIARLLILTLPQPLPETMEDGWVQYLQAWRPGRPRYDRWLPFWNTADLVTREQAHLVPAVEA